MIQLDFMSTFIFIFILGGDINNRENQIEYNR